MVPLRHVLATALFFSGIGVSGIAEPLAALSPPVVPEALGRQLRIDLLWAETPGDSDRAIYYEVQGAAAKEGPYEALHPNPWPLRMYSDFLGKAGVTRYYRVRALNLDASGEQVLRTGGWSIPATATSGPVDRTGLAAEVQEAGFRYFYHYGHPVSGLAREGSPPRQPDVCASGATGMGLFNLVVGAERGFVSRDAAARRVGKILRFLGEQAERHHGAYSHWLHGKTGRIIRFGRHDDGVDLVETAFLAAGFLVVREYFDGESPAEQDVRRRADGLWRAIEWDWFVRDREADAYLPWHWSPTHGYEQTMPIAGFNEAQIAYVLAVASPTHGIDPAVYWSGWETPKYGTKRTVFGVPMELHHGMGGALFLTHYTHLGLDPRAVFYNGTSYLDHFRNWCRMQVAYVRSRSGEFEGYDRMWGLTSSADPSGYRDHSPGKRDNGTLSPTAALSSIPYLPEEAMDCLVEMYRRGKTLWGPCGFYDAFNPTRDWVANHYLGIDVGPIAPMIENHRTGLCWDTFMKAPEIQSALDRIGIGQP